MQLVIKNGQVICWHGNDNATPAMYPGCEVVYYDGPASIPPTDFDPRKDAIFPDPRTTSEKAQAYKSQRRFEYPAITDQLDMIYRGVETLPANDPFKKALKEWVDTIGAIKAKYLKPDGVVRVG